MHRYHFFKFCHLFHMKRLYLHSNYFMVYFNSKFINLVGYCNSIFLFYPITLEGRRGTTDEFATTPFHLDLFSAALVELAKSIPVHSLILSSHLFFCLPLFLFPFTVPCRIVFAKPEDLETWPYIVICKGNYFQRKRKRGRSLFYIVCRKTDSK